MCTPFVDERKELVLCLKFPTCLAFLTFVFFQMDQEATRNKCIATSNGCLTSSNKKLLETIVSNSFLLTVLLRIFRGLQCGPEIRVLAHRIEECLPQAGNHDR